MKDSPAVLIVDDERNIRLTLSMALEALEVPVDTAESGEEALQKLAETSFKLMLLDLKLRQQGILPSEVKGYDHELDTHLAVATAITRGEADVGLGIEAAAHQCSTGFLPLFRERYDLVIPVTNYRSHFLSPLLRIVASDDFRKVVTDAGGYDASQMGATTFCN